MANETTNVSNKHKQLMSDGTAPQLMLRLRSLSTLLVKPTKSNYEKGFSTKEKGSYLKKVLRRKLHQADNECTGCVVDVFESMVNQKVTYTKEDVQKNKFSSNSLPIHDNNTFLNSDVTVLDYESSIFKNMDITRGSQYKNTLAQKHLKSLNPNTVMDEDFDLYDLKMGVRFDKVLKKSLHCAPTEEENYPSIFGRFKLGGNAKGISNTQIYTETSNYIQKPELSQFRVEKRKSEDYH